MGSAVDWEAFVARDSAVEADSDSVIVESMVLGIAI